MQMEDAIEIMTANSPILGYAESSINLVTSKIILKDAKAIVGSTILILAHNSEHAVKLIEFQRNSGIFLHFDDQFTNGHS